nr:Strongly-conserved Zn-finger binding protein (TFIIIA) [Polyrhizophydium stewartii]
MGELPAQMQADGVHFPPLGASAAAAEAAGACVDARSDACDGDWDDSASDAHSCRSDDSGDSDDSSDVGGNGDSSEDSMDADADNSDRPTRSSGWSAVKAGVKRRRSRSSTPLDSTETTPPLQTQPRTQYPGADDPQSIALAQARALALVGSRRPAGSPAATPAKATSRSGSDSPAVAAQDKPFRCTYPGCERAFPKVARLNRHALTHTQTRPYACDECDRTFRRTDHLSLHKQSHKATEAERRPWACDHEGCTARFIAKTHRDKHIQQTHLVCKPYACAVPGCTASFVKQSKLRAHTADHTGRLPYPCAECDKSFRTAQKLRAHAWLHKPEAQTRYSCAHDGCGMRFAKWSLLQVHARTAHTVACTVCGKEFLRTNSLTAHMKTHSLDREQFMCTWEGCGKCFYKKTGLEVHVNTVHLKLRPWACEVEGCGRAFGTKGMLVRHGVTHQPGFVPRKDRRALKRASAVLLAVASGTTAALTAPDSARSNNGSCNGNGNGSGADRECAEDPSDAEFAQELDRLTGYKYLTTRAIPCEFPDCPFRFSRLYDLERHLRMAHDVTAQPSDHEPQDTDNDDAGPVVDAGDAPVAPELDRPAALLGVSAGGSAGGAVAASDAAVVVVDASPPASLVPAVPL